MPEGLPQTGEGSAPDHLVQVYRDRFELADAVAVFFSAGIAAGEAAVAVATPTHWAAIADRLAERGHALEALRADGRLVVVDADETLAAIVEDGGPSLPLFRRVIGGLLDRAAGGSRHVRVFGEMVDILCRRGERGAADVVESHWSELRRERRFDLLCGYRLDLFDRDVQVNLLPEIYRSHSAVLPLVQAEALDDAVEHALADVLGDEDARKVRAQVGRHPGDERISEGQRTLMWVSAHMPRAAEQILSVARERYLHAGGPSAA